MSLFAAYSEQAKELEEAQSIREKPEWLENSSFNPNIIVNQDRETVPLIPDKEYVTLSEATSSDSKAPKAKKKHKEEKRKHQKKKNKGKYLDDLKKEEAQSSEGFTLDITKVNEYQNVQTISRPAVAKYHVKYYLTSNQRKKKHKFKRYFKFPREKNIEKSDNEESEKLTKQNIDMAGFSERDVNFTGFNQEEDLSKKTGFYNKSLTDNPDDIKMWLKYVEFQDVVYQFEKSYRKGSIAKAQRVLAERKISILDKALLQNPNCEELLRERIKIAVSTFPADELQSQFQNLLKKEQDNIILWQGYIESTQCSMSHCNAASVISLYSKCLSTLHRLRRTTMTEKYIFEESILRMLYQCGLFLKQAGLFEQLWTLLKMYLELNLSPLDKNRFNVERKFNEKELLELEEVVLNSQLPHHELWLRTEKLRESCHWLPYKGSEECEDPQRMVFTEDVVELIHPITMPENIFKLVATILTLLKVPLLPCRHSTMQDLGLDYVPWSLDSIEALLPIFVPLYPVDTSNENLLKDTQRLAVGPQYLKVLPGQEEYLNFVLSVMENCAECLKNQDQISVYVWWFRFQRLLVILDKQGRFKMPAYLKKKIKTSIKNLLKKAEHRNNEIFYIEYALIEKEFGNVDQCFKILETALSMNKNTSIETQNWEQDQANQCYLYKTLTETTLASNSQSLHNTIKYLVKLAVQRNFETVTNGLLMEAETKFKMVTADLLQSDIENLSCLEHFFPDFFTDWVVCNGWFLFFYKGPLECGTFLENVLEKLEEKPKSLAFRKEVLYEFYCAVLFKYCVEHPGSGVFKILDSVLFRAIENYPNNLYLLSILSKEMTMVKNMGTGWWKVQNLLLRSGRAITTIFTVIICDLIKLEIEKEVKDTITGNNVEMTSSFKNKMLALFKKITKSDMCTRRCGLAWRLYLQFVHNYFDLTLCRNVYYSAVEECPWLKALYMDAAIYIPAELGQIQDLIIEKQLRLHVSPEELEILRS